MSEIDSRRFSILRIVFGVVWLVDALFKWNPAFLNNFTDYIVQGGQGQSVLVQNWINLWVRVVGMDPYIFAVIVAVSETAIAISLLSGLFTEIGIFGGIAMTLVIWSTAEGFGGPYVAGSTDIGAAIIYAIVFIALWFGKCWRYYSIDSIIKDKLPSLYWHW